jgi:dephospho-CoA kinase
VFIGMIIAIVGLIGAGKDLVADFLVSEHGFKSYPYECFTEGVGGK